MTANKPEVFEVYRTRQGTLENVVLLADYEALQADCERLRKDAERLNFITQRPGWLHSRKGWWGCVNPFTNYSYPMFKNPRDAIDAAMEGDNP